jgi:hypothetical protein
MHAWSLAFSQRQTVYTRCVLETQGRKNQFLKDSGEYNDSANAPVLEWEWSPLMYRHSLTRQQTNSYLKTITAAADSAIYTLWNASSSTRLKRSKFSNLLWHSLSYVPFKNNELPQDWPYKMDQTEVCLQKIHKITDSEKTEWKFQLNK